MYKIYYGDKLLMITSTSDAIIRYPLAPRLLFAEGGLHTAVEALHTMETQSSILIAEDENTALDALKKNYLVVKAGGGVVHTTDAHVLLIFRRGKWDLPKGKLDDGEDMAACAVREVEEETGLVAPSLQEKILVTYHTYSEKGKEILKESHWYRMTVREKQMLQPQTEEDIELCEWVSVNNLEKYKKNMHPSVKDVLAEGAKYITF